MMQQVTSQWIAWFWHSRFSIKNFTRQCRVGNKRIEIRSDCKSKSNTQVPLQGLVDLILAIFWDSRICLQFCNKGAVEAPSFWCHCGHFIHYCCAAFRRSTVVNEVITMTPEARGLNSTIVAELQTYLGISKDCKNQIHQALKQNLGIRLCFTITSD